MPRVGIVHLVGAGPGDPGLLTRRAAELLSRADVVALDALVSSDIAALIPASAHVVHVGKRSSAHTLPQEEINALLIAEAKKGHRVVRLKGGDPFVFGRGGEEAEELLAAGVPVEIVPGISSSIAGPAYAGIPVTHRSYSTSFTVVTGHESEGSTGVDWPVIAKLGGTVVFLMGFGNLANIARKLIEHGMAADRPVAVISKATTPEQRTVTGTLTDIEARVAEAQLVTPALIVVGDVVAMREVINWYEARPLFGKRIVVTRAREQASELRRLLEESGANVLQFPTIEIAPPKSWEALDAAVAARYDWLIFTSANGVRSYFERLHAGGRDTRALAGTKIAAVGAVTAAELRAQGLVPDVLPEKFLSTALLPLLAEDQTGVRTAVIRAEEGRDELVEELRRRGGSVDLVVAYRTIAAMGDLDALRALIAEGRIDVVTFTSASTVDHFFAPLTAEERERVLRDTRLASIGPTTSEALRKHGRGPDIEAANATVESLHEAVLTL